MLVPGSRDTGLQARGSRTGLAIYSVWPVLEPNAAAIDVGAREMFVAVPPVDIQRCPAGEKVKQNSNGKRNDWATNLFPLNPSASPTGSARGSSLGATLDFANHRNKRDNIKTFRKFCGESYEAS